MRQLEPKKKASESQKALWAMKAAKDRVDELYHSTRKENILVRKQTRLDLWQEHLKYPTIALDKSDQVLGEPVSRLIVGSSLL